MSGEPRWTVRITDSAENDIRAAVRWSEDRFGARQARVYAETLSQAIFELRAGPDLIGVKQRLEIAPGLLSIHVARRDRKGRHFVMFRVVDEQARVLEVLRLLHDAMDLPRHIPK
jgi:toxin ParE1/3/4